MRSNVLLFSACILSVFCLPAQAAKKPIPPPAPLDPSELHAELLTHLYVNKIKVDEPVIARVMDPWESHGCKLRQGAILTGHITKAEPVTFKSGFSTLEFSFDTAECDGQASRSFPFTLIAILPASSGADADQLESQSLVRAMVSSQNMVNSYEKALSEKGELAFTLNNYTSISSFHNPRVPTGKVVGYQSLQLDAGIGPDNSSRVYMKDRNLRLERTTSLILVPSPQSAAPVTTFDVREATSSPSQPASAATNTVVAAEPPPPPPAPEPIDETDICSSVCNSGEDSSLSPRTIASNYRLPITNLGFAANANRPVTSFGYGATLTYLDESNLLFTFDPHKLRHRVGVGILNEPVRTVRAVLIDPKTHAIKHVYEWEIYGQGQYLWPAGPGRILVHVNRQLSLLGPTLKPIQTLPLEGTLDWASVSPSGDHFVVGTIHERHTEPLHRLIVEHTGFDPEEDIDVRLYDSDFKLVFSTRQSSTDRPAILSDFGELRLHPVSPHRWQLDEERWDHTTRHLITTTSYCRPSISAQSSGQLFLAGCTDVAGLRWYRMLRPDGHPVLKRNVTAGEIEHSADTSAPTEFAIRVIKTTQPLYPGKAFNKIDLDSEEISVYRARDGHQIFTTRTGDMPLMVQSFALSPTGHNIALLDNQSISFYTVGSSPQP
jgi:hypothetical protein